VRRATLTLSLLAHAVDAVYYGRLGGVQVEFKGEVIRDGCKLLRHAIANSRLPIAIPDQSLRLLRPRDAGPGPIQSLCMKKPSAIDITQREVRHPNVAHVPSTVRLRFTVDALAEKSQLETELAAFLRVHVAGVIPPLSLIVGMVEVIARKFVAITRKREPPHHRERDRASTLHGSLRWAPAAWRRGPGTIRQPLSQHKPAPARRAGSP